MPARLPEIVLVDSSREAPPPSPLEARARELLGQDVAVKALGREVVAQRGDGLLVLGASGVAQPVTGLEGAIQWPPSALPGGRGALVLSTANHGLAYRLWQVRFAEPVAQLLVKGGAEAGEDDGDLVSWSRAAGVSGGYVVLGDDRLCLVGEDGTVRDEAPHGDLTELETIFDGRCVVLSEDEGPTLLFAVAGDRLVRLAELPADPRDIVVEGTRVFWTDFATEDGRCREAVGLHDALVAAGA